MNFALWLTCQKINACKVSSNNLFNVKSSTIIFTARIILLSHRAKKRFGQNFLIDFNIIQSLVTAISPKQTDNIIEIGPGLGALTQPLLNLVNGLEVIELDRDLIRKLKDLNNQTNKLTIHECDALKFDFSQTHNPRRIVGNLPYNISTPLIFHLLEYIDSIIDMHFMLQNEVVNRICANTGDRNYGRLSVMVQIQCQTQKLLHVGAQSFSPAPKVESAFIRLTPHKQSLIPVNLLNDFSSIVQMCFAHPRKTVNNNLKKLLSQNEIIDAGIDPSERPQQLTLENLISLTNIIKK